jgi:hypothetical protein
MLTLLLGPATVDSQYISFAWLAVLSLGATLLMLSARDWLLIPVGIVGFLCAEGRASIRPEGLDVRGRRALLSRSSSTKLETAV